MSVNEVGRSVTRPRVGVLSRFSRGYASSFRISAFNSATSRSKAFRSLRSCGRRVSVAAVSWKSFPSSAGKKPVRCAGFSPQRVMAVAGPTAEPEGIVMWPLIIAAPPIMAWSPNVVDPAMPPQAAITQCLPIRAL